MLFFCYVLRSSPEYVYYNFDCSAGVGHAVCVCASAISIRGEKAGEKEPRSELHFLSAPISVSGMFGVKYSSANEEIKIYSYASLRERR